MRRNLLTSVCVISVVSRVVANVIFINHGYCDFEIFPSGTQPPEKSVGTLFARRSARFKGNLSTTFRLFRQGREVRRYDVPMDPPGLAHPRFAVDKENDKHDHKHSHFHSFIIAGDEFGTDCESPLPRSPADVWTASSVILISLCVLFGSILWGTAAPSHGELAGWALVLAIYYFSSPRLVHDVSMLYHDACTNLAGQPLVANKVHGDRIWGLHADFPTISWFFGGRRWDLKDKQLRSFVESFPMLVGFCMFYLLVKHFWAWMWSVDHSKAVVAQKSQQQSRAFITLLLGLGFAGFLHEAQLLLPLGVAFLNFVITVCLGRGRLRVLIPITSWLLGIASLAASAGSLTLQSVLGIAGQAGANLGLFLDSFKGEMGWYVAFNFIVLKMISWSCDFAWSLDVSSREGHEYTAQNPNINDRTEEQLRADSHRGTDEYCSLVLYFAYMFYPPLYLAGPTITFNAFASYMACPQATYSRKALCIYGVRWLADVFVLIAYGHFLYTFAIVTNGPLRLWRGDLATTLDSVFAFGGNGESLIWFSFWALKGVWLKFLAIWRFARLWALVDGVCPPENMNRCMSNNYTVRGFWRAWHRSFNRWLVKYIFIPLGGSWRTSMLRRLSTVLVVFMFVVFWHEPVLLQKDWAMVHVLAWGLLMTLFMAPEMIAEMVCRTSAVRKQLDNHPLLARHLTAFGGAACIQLLLIANLIGYAYGIHGARVLLDVCNQRSMVVFLVAFYFWFVAKTQFMLVIRQQEVEHQKVKAF